MSSDDNASSIAAIILGAFAVAFGFAWRRNRGAGEGGGGGGAPPGAPSGITAESGSRNSREYVVPAQIAKVPPHPTSPEMDAAIRRFAEMLRAEWQAVTGRAPTEREIQIALGVSWAESGIMPKWDGDMAGSWNRGGVQCFKRDMDPGPPPPYYRCVMHIDHKPGGQEYTTGFRFYQEHEGKSAEAWSVHDFAKQLTTVRPATAGVLADPNASLWDVCASLYRNNYFGGWGDHPVSDYAARIWADLPAIAAALGEPIAVASGPAVV